MDWKLTVALVMAVVALFMGMRYRKLRKDVDKFAGQMEQSFDAIVEGESEAEVLEDSLFAKLQEKLLRQTLIHVWDSIMKLRLTWKYLILFRVTVCLADVLR